MNRIIVSATEQQFIRAQNSLVKKIQLENAPSLQNIKTISGIDLAYWEKGGSDFAVCCIVTIDFETQTVIETACLSEAISVPYVAGFLSFRELPLILKTYELLENKADVAIFDGNGYLHSRHMGIATHASFYLNIPTIGVAKSYLKIEGTEFTMPENIAGSYSDIIINDEIYGRALRTRKDVKPMFVSCGNWIDLDTSMDIVLKLVGKESRQPLPTRLADIETKKMRKKLLGCAFNSI